MLLVCPDCSHRYRIPAGDDGRVLRFACRKCGAAIDSRQHRSEDALPTLAEGSGWLVIHGGRASGPFDTRALVGMARARRFGARSLVWSDGAEAWNVAGNTPPLGPARAVAWWVKIDDAEVDPIVAGLGQVLAARPGHGPSVDALEKLIRVGRGGAAARAHFERALLDGGERRRLVDVLEDRLALTDARADRVALRARIGGLYEALGEPAAAAAAYAEALRDTPHELALIEGLLRTSEGDATHLIRRLEGAIDGLDPEEAARVRLRIARIHADGDRPEAALTALDTVDTHISGPEARALRVELYRRLARWPALAALYAEIASETTGGERRDALRSLAELLGGTLGDPAAAAATWATLADEWPEDDDAVERLAALVGAHPELDEPAAILDRTLETRGDWAGVYALRAGRIDHAPPGSARAGAMAALAALCVERLGDAPAAYTWAARAVAERPYAEDYRRLHAELARAAERLSAWVDAAVAAFEADPALVDVYVEAAASMPLSDVDRERLHRAVLRLAPGHDEAFAVLRAMADGPQRLHALIDARLAVAPDERRALLAERAAIEAGPLADPERAWATWGVLLDSGPDRAALEARLALAERLEDPARRLGALDALRAVEADAARRLTLDRAAARLAGELGDAADAIARWEAIFESGAGDPAESVDALVELCAAAGDDAGCIRALERRRALVGALASADLRRLAALYHRAGQREPARAAFRVLVDRDPTDDDALDGLEAASDDPRDHFEVAVLRLARADDKGTALAALVPLADAVAEDRAGLIFAAASVVHTGDDAGAGRQIELRMQPDARPLLIDAWGQAAAAHGHAALYRRRAGWCEAAGRATDARADWRMACAADPEDPSSWRARMRLAEGVGDIDEVLLCLDALIDLDDARPLYRRRGALLAEQGRTADAIEAWRAARCPDDPKADAPALDALIDLYDPTDDREALAAALDERARIAEASGEAVAGDLAARQARLAEADNRIEAAIAAWERALDLGFAPTTALAALEPLYAIEGRIDDQARTLGRHIAQVEGAERRALRARRARLLTLAGDAEGALSEWDATLAEAPGDLDALWAAYELRVERGDWPEAVESARRLLATLPADDPRSDALCRARARALVDPLDRPAEAVDAWSAVLARAAGDSEALDALEALYARLDDPAGLVSTLERRRARGERPDGALLRRIGALRVDRLGDADGALAAFDGALALDPGDGAAFERAVAILDARADAAGALDRIERHVAHAPEPIALHARAAALAEQLERPEAALAHVAAAMRAGGRDADFGDVAERLAGRGAGWETPAAAWEAALADVRGTPASLPLHRRLMAWARDPLADAPRALRHAAGVLALEPADVEALTVRADCGAEPATVAEALGRLYSISEDGRGRRARRLGALHAGPLDDPARAAHWFERALEADPTDSEALAGLGEVYRGDENWPALRIVRLRQADRVRSDLEAGRGSLEVHAALLAEAARLSARLGAPGQALDDWAEVLGVDPRHAEALSEARALHRAAGDWAAAVELGERLLEQVEDGDLRRDQARILDERLDRAEPAIAAWRALLAAAPDDPEALAALDRRFTLAGAPGELAGILTARLRLDPEDADLWVRLGVARRAVGDIERARAAFDEALSRAPTHQDAFEAGLALAAGPAEVLDRIEAHLAHTDPGARHALGLHARAIDAALAAAPARAVPHLAAALAATRDDARFGPPAERVAAATGERAPVIEAWRAAAVEADRREALPLHRRILRWSTERPDDAAPHAEALLVADPDDVEALTALGRASDPRIRADALARLHPLTDEADQRAERAAAVADIHAHALDDPRAAVGWYESALADRPDDPALLDRLADAHRAAGDRFALCRTHRRQAAAARGAARIAFRAEAARLATALGDPHAARDWAAVLADAPDHREALEAALDLARQRGDAAAMIDLGDRLLALVAPDEPARPELLRAQARLLAASESRSERAIDLWRAVLDAAPGDAEALDALDDLYGAVGDAHGLLAVLDARRAGRPAPGLLVRSGDIRRAELGDDRGALADYDAALAADPLHGEAFDRACALCAALGDTAGELDRIEARLERVEAATARGALRERAGALAERSERPPAALRHWSAAARLTGDDARIGPTVERLAAETGDWATPAAAWRAALIGRSAADALPLRRRLLAWARGPLADEAEARVHAEHILALAPTDRDALEASAEAAANPAERIAALSRLHAIAEAPAERAALARELGRLHAADAPGRGARWFEAALDADPTDRAALEGLAELHRARDARAPLLAVRLRQAELDGDARWLVEAARLAEQLGRLDEATTLWQRVVGAADPDGSVEALDGELSVDHALRALTRLLDGQARWAELDDVLALRIEQADAETRRTLWRRRAALAAERLDDPEAALAAWRAILADDPDDEEALWAALASSEGPDRTALRRRLVARLPAGDERRIELLRALAREAGPRSRARAWAAVLEDAPGDAEALDALEAACEAAEDWPALVRVLLERVGDPPSDAGRLLRVARLRDERLGDPRAAAEAYAALLGLTPDDEDAFARLVELYIAAGDPAAALARIESRLDRTRDPAARLALHRRAAELADARLGRPAEALAHICRAFAESRDDARFGPEAARLARQLDDWTAPVAAWSGAIDGVPAAAALALHLRLGGWAAGPMGDPRLARRHYRAALALEPGHHEALRALAALAEDDPADRAEALEGLLAAEADPEARRALAVRLGDLYAGPLADPDRAVARYRAALDGVDDAEALAGLARVHASRGAWAPLLAVRARQITRLDGPARAATRVEMARLAERLGRVDAAIEAWRTAIEEGADPHAALPALDAWLTAHRRWAPLADVIIRRIALAAGDRSTERALRARLAALRADRLDDPEGARAEWAALHRLDPRDREALRALRALADGPEARVEANRRLLDALPGGDPDRGPLRREIARICTRPPPAGLDRPAEAIAAWQLILDETPGDAEALDALEALHARAHDPAALIEVLRLRHAAAPSTALRLRIGGLHESAGAPAEALAEYRAVLDAAPGHAEAFARARRLLIAAGDGPGLRALVEGRLARVAEPAARRALAEEAARLAEEQGDLPRAVHWLGEAFATCRDDAAYGDGMARLADLAEARTAAVARWRAAAEALAGTPEAIPLHLRLHAWLAPVDPAAAAAELAEAARLAPDDPRVLRIRARAAEGDHDHPTLLRALLALRRQAADSTRVDLTRRIARLLAGPLDNPEAALAEYTRLLDARPDDGEALARRADLLRRLDRPEALFAVLGELLDRDPDPDRRRALLEERAALAERQGWTDAAIDGWRAVLASSERSDAAWAALETLYAADGRLDDLEALFVRRAAAEPDPTAATLRVRAARVAESRADAAAARAHYEAALTHDPDCAPALRALAALHARAGDTAARARLEARLAAGLPDDTPEAVDRWRAIGRMCQGAGDAAQAIEAWSHVRRAVPDDEEALAALGELYALVGDDGALADALADRAGALTDGGARAALLARVGGLRAGIGDTPGAIAAWRAVFRLDPAADEPFDALETLLAGDWPALAGLLLERAAALPAGPRRVALRLRAAELLAERAARPGDALAARLAVFADQPDDAAHGAVIDALADAADGHARAAAAYTMALDRGLPVERAVPLRMRLARWQSGPLGAPEDAIAQYCAVLDRVPDHAEALARMEALRAEIGDWSALASLLQQRVARAADDESRLSALRRLGRVQARQAGAAQAAIATWRRIRRARPDDDEAADALLRLYRETERWPALVRALEELPPTPARLREIAGLCRGALDDAPRAIDALERARAIDPDDPETGAALLDAYRGAGRWADMRALYADLVRRRPPAERPALYRDLAALLEEHLADADAAADAWRAVVRLVPTDAEAVTALDRIERAAGRHGPLADVWARHVAALPAEQSVPARLTLAGLYRAAGDPYRAIDALRPALDLPRGRADVLRALADLYAGTGDWRYCAEVLDREIRLAPPAERVARLREAVEVRERHLRDPLGAFERVAEAWRLEPADESLAVDAARLSNRVGRPRALLDLYREIQGRVSAVPARGRVLRAAARLARQLGDAGTEADAWRALHDAVDPDDREALDGLIRLLSADGAWSALRPMLEARMALDPAAGTALALAVLTAEHLARPGEAAGWYRRALALDPGDRRALAGLVDIERSREAWPALYHALDRLAERLDGPEEAAVRAEQATLAAERLGRPADARRLWETVLRLRGADDAEALAALDRLLSGGDDDRALIDVLERRLAAGESPAPLHVRLAEVHAGQGRAPAALDHWRRALDAEPDCVPALWAVHQGSDDPAEVIATRRRLLARLGPDDPRRLSLLRAHARHTADSGDAAAAIAAWRAVRAEAALDAEAVAALAALYAQIDERAALADLLAETGADRLRAAQLYVELGRPRVARRLFERILAADPAHAEASAALADIHRAALRWPALADVLRARIEATGDATTRAAVRRELAEIQHRRLRDPGAALETSIAAFDERPDPAAIPALNALAAETGAWPALADCAERALDAGEADPAPLHRWLTALYAEHLEMPQAAAAHARRAWRLTGDDAARARLEALLTAAEDWDGLAEVWAAHADRLPADAQREALVALARLHAERRGDPAAATAVWQDVLAADPRDADALDALAALHRESDRLDELCAVLERRFEQAEDVDARIELAGQIAELAAHLGDPMRAVPPLRAVVDATGRPALSDRLAALLRSAGRSSEALAVRLEAVSRLPDAEARGRALVALADDLRAPGRPPRWRGLRMAWPDDAPGWQAVDALLEAVGRWDDRAALATIDAEVHGGRDRWVTVARLHQDRRRDAVEALAAWQVALITAPGDAAILDAIEAIHRADGRADRFADVLRAQIDRVPPPRGAELALRLADLEARHGAPAAVADAVERALDLRADAIDAAADAMPSDDADAIRVIEHAIDGLDRLGFARAAADDRARCVTAGQRALALAEAAGRPLDERIDRRVMLAALGDTWDALYAEAVGGPLLDPLLDALVDRRPNRWRAFARRAAEQIDTAAAWARLARGLEDVAPARAPSAWKRALDHDPAHGEALVHLAASDRAMGDVDAAVRRQIVAAGIDRGQLDGLLALADDPAPSPAARHAALEAAHGIDPARTPLDSLAEARLAVGDAAGWRVALDEARRVDADPEGWAARTVTLADAGADWAALIDDDAGRLDALDGALAADDRWTDVAELRGLRAERAPSVEHHRALARVTARLGRTADAFEAWRAVLDDAPADVEALGGVAALEPELPPSSTAAVYVEQLPHVDDPAEAVTRALRLADLVERLPDPRPALDALDAALARHDDPRLVERVARAKAATGDDAGAAALWARALDAVDEAAERAARLGELADLRSRAGDLDGAFDAAAEAALLRPDSDLEDARLTRLADATDRLADRARTLGEVHDRATDPERRRALRETLAALFGGPLAGTDDAERWWRARLAADPDDAPALAALIERLQGAERWADLADLYAERAAARPSEAAALHTARARIFADRLGDPVAEREAWRAVHEVDPRDEAALRALWRLDDDPQRRDGLARALLDRLPAGDPLHPALHRWLAPRSARPASHWRAVLSADPEADDAADALEDLRRAAGDHDAVRALLDRKLARAADPDTAAEVWRAIAETERARGDGPAARAAWREVLARRPGDLRAEAALAEAHLAADDVEAWAALRLRQLDGVDDPAARAELYREVARTLEARLPDAGPAFDVVARAFAERPHDGALSAELIRLAERSGRRGALADIWRSALDRVEGRPAATLALRLAELEQRRGRMDAAAEAWRRALAADPKALPALEGLEHYALDRGDDALLADILAARLRTPSGEAEALDRWRRLARLHGEAGRVAEAEAGWHAVLQRRPDDAEALEALADVYAADAQWRALTEVLLRQLVAAEGPRAVALRRRLALVCLEELDDRAAARAALDPIADETDDPELLALLVDLTRAEADWPACAALLDRLARRTRGAQARDAWVARADIQRDHLHDPAGARASLGAAAEIEPRHRPALEGLWRLAEDADDAPAAARALARLEPLGDPDSRARWLTRLGELHADALGDPAAAVEAWHRALTADPAHGPALRRLAEHALAERRWPEAAILLDRLLAAEPDAEPSRLRERHLAAARCAEALDDDEATRRHFEAALDLDATHRPALLALADLAFRQGDWARAFQVGQALLVHHGADLEPAERADRLHRLGALKALLGEPERARAFYRQALEAWSGHGPSRRALSEAPGAPTPAPVDGDPSWIGEAELLDAEDAALEAYLYGDGPAPALDAAEEVDDFEEVADDAIEGDPAPEQPAAPPPLPAIRRTAAYASPMAPPADVEGAVERAVEGTVGRAIDRIVERIGERPVEVKPTEDLAAVTRAAESAAAEAAAAARAAEAAAEAAHAGAAAMTALPLATAAALEAPGEPRERAPVRPIKASKVRVLRRTSPRRRYLYAASAAAVLIAGLSAGLFAVQSYRLEETVEDNARLTRVSESLARRVSATQLAFERVTRELRGDPLEGDMPTERAIALFDEDGQPLDEVMLELAFRDLEMREELGAVKGILAAADAGRADATERSKALELQVATLQSHIDGLKAQQTEVHERLAGRLDQNIQAIETALTATGIDFDALADPELGKTPIVVAGLDDQPLTGAGGPFIADGTSEYVNPVPGETEVMSGFGPRGHSHHNGIDIPAPIGTAVLAVSAGEVIHVQDRVAWQGRPKWIEKNDRKIKSQGWRAGIYVELEQDDGRISRYMHLAAVAPGIEVGARVLKGQVLGSVGRTGVEKSDTHLHFELREPPSDGGRYGAALDPTAAVHKDDVDVIMGSSLLHADPSIIDVSPEAERALKSRQDAAGADEEAIVERLDGRMDRLQSLEKLLREMPLVPPVDDFKVSSRFGRRLDPLNGEWGFHGGLDIPGHEGSPIRATAPGTVVFSGDRGRYGIMVEIDHGNGVTTRYGHLLRSLVRKGQRVRYRARIGEMGSSGRTTGTHLHYEVRVDGNPRDPMNFIQAGRYVFKR